MISKDILKCFGRYDNNDVDGYDCLMTSGDCFRIQRSSSGSQGSQSSGTFDTPSATVRSGLSSSLSSSSSNYANAQFLCSGWQYLGNEKSYQSSAGVKNSISVYFFGFLAISWQ